MIFAIYKIKASGSSSSNAKRNFYKFDLPGMGYHQCLLEDATEFSNSAQAHRIAKRVHGETSIVSIIPPRGA